MESPKPDKRFLLFLGAFFLAWTVRVRFLFMDQGLISEWTRQYWSQALRVLLWIVPVAVYLVRVENTKPLHYLKLNVLPHGRRLVYSILLSTAFFTVTIPAAILFQGGRLAYFADVTASWLLLSLSTTAFVAVAEETMFRGFVFQHLRQRHGFAVANAITVLLFLMIHLPGWLALKNPGVHLVSLSLGILFIGWVLGWLMELSQSLWPPILLHFVNNVMSSILLH
jgi:membrane protease YdiL (CAAX protease family)